MALGTTVDALVQRVRRDSLLASRGPLYTLGSSYTAGGTTISLAEASTHIGPGTILSIDYELFYVKSGSAATATFTVIPGYFGTTQANHSSGAVIEVDPRFPAVAIRDWAQQEIQSWGSELFRVTDLTLDATTVDRTYELVHAALDISFIERDTNVVEADVGITDHGVSVGDTVTVNHEADSFDGTFVVTVVTGSLIRWAQTGSNESSSVAGTLRRHPGEVYFLLDVRQRPTGTSTNFWFFSWTGSAWPHLDARLLRNMSDQTGFTSGLAIQFVAPPTHASDVRIALAQPFDLDPFESTTDLVADVGLRAEWIDIAELGAKWRALTTTVIGRSDWRTSNMARNAEEVSALDTVRVATHLADLRQLRFTKAATDLRADWGYRESH